MQRWRRKSDVDLARGIRFPIPTQIVSNEEYDPPPRTRAQARVEAVLLDLGDRCARKLSIDRRTFFRSSAGLAAAFLALDHVFGPYFAVAQDEIHEGSRSERFFILDAQTHHVPDGPERVPENQQFLDYLNLVRRFGGNWNPALAGREIDPSELHRATYIKEVFLDSQTDVAVLSALPQLTRESYVIPPEEIARTKSWVNELADSRRVLAHGVLSPELGAVALESMQAQVEGLGIDAWKGYPGQPLSANGAGWWLDDEEVAYPALTLSRKLGIKNIALHKGLPAQPFSAEHCHPRDVFRASVDFPDLNFLVYHAGFQGVREAFPAIEDEFRTKQDIPWVTELCAWKREHPEVSNVFIELGATFGMTVITFPLLTCHLLGMVLRDFGVDHVLWGTDSIWWGSPQWQIEALCRLEMPVELQERFGYPALTREVKARIFGLNAAQIYGVDVDAPRGDVPSDFLEVLRRRDRGDWLGPSRTQYGWVRG